MSHPVNRKALSVMPDPQLERSLRLALVTGLVLVVLLPMARGSSDWLGWLPLWLVGMPGVALWSLHRFRLPLAGASVRASGQDHPRRRRSAQARRRALPAMKPLSRAA